MKGSAGLLSALVSLLLFASLAFVSPQSANAYERAIAGDVVVEREDTVEDVSTVQGNVVVLGTVENDVRTGMGRVEVRGPVGGDVETGVGEVLVNAPVEGGVKTGMGDVEVRERVAGDVETGFGEVLVDAPVEGSIRVGHGAIHLERGEGVLGDVSVGDGTIEGDSREMVGGRVLTGMNADMVSDVDGAHFFSGVVRWLTVALGLAACAALLSVIAPGALASSARQLEAAPGRALLLGVASVPAAVIIAVLLAVTVIGLPLLPLAAPAYLTLLFFGAIVVAYAVGRRVSLLAGRYRAGDAFAAAVGAVLISAVSLIPFFGWIALCFIAFIGAGAALMALFSRSRLWPRRTPHSSYEDYVRDRRT